MILAHADLARNIKIVMEEIVNIHFNKILTSEDILKLRIGF